MNAIAAAICAGISAAVPFAAGVSQKSRNRRYLKMLPLRINVNGIRGKSTVSRLIFAILKHAGIKAAGKTTGSAARMFYWDMEDEIPIRRRPRGVTIGEQLDVIRDAVKHGAKALVCECMAVRPQYQLVFQQDMLRANVGVIVNVTKDHLEEMGPDLSHVARALSSTVPYGGILVITKGEFAPYFEKIAKERGSRVFVADESALPQNYPERFQYGVFPQNVAIALETARALGIPDEISLEAMPKAAADPGAFCVLRTRGSAMLANAFAANDPRSTFDIWKRLAHEGYDISNPVIVFNCRGDRHGRTKLLADNFLSKLPPYHLIAIGDGAGQCKKLYEEGRTGGALDFAAFSRKKDMDAMMDYMTAHRFLDSGVIMCIGNIHGMAGDFLKMMTCAT